MGDECLIAPLGLFTPELLGVTGPKTIVTQKRSTGDPQDPHDADYLRETSVRLMHHLFKAHCFNDTCVAQAIGVFSHRSWF